jgi:hypothetical protein
MIRVRARVLNGFCIRLLSRTKTFIAQLQTICFILSAYSLSVAVSSMPSVGCCHRFQARRFSDLFTYLLRHLQLTNTIATTFEQLPTALAAGDALLSFLPRIPSTDSTPTEEPDEPKEHTIQGESTISEEPTISEQEPVIVGQPTISEHNPALPETQYHLPIISIRILTPNGLSARWGSPTLVSKGLASKTPLKLLLCPVASLLSPLLRSTSVRPSTSEAGFAQTSSLGLDSSGGIECHDQHSWILLAARVYSHIPHRLIHPTG